MVSRVMSQSRTCRRTRPPPGYYYMSSNSRESYSSSAKPLPDDFFKVERGICEYVRPRLLIYHGRTYASLPRFGGKSTNRLELPYDS